MDITIDLKEFITDKFEMHNKVLDQKFRTIEGQFESQNKTLADLKESVNTLQEFVSEIETPREAALSRENFKMEIGVLKSQIETTCALNHKENAEEKTGNAIGQFIMKYPKAIVIGLASALVLLLTGDLTKLFHLLGF